MLDRKERSDMPNKTIYVADADVLTFERAQELAGGNLSATIVQALRRYIEMEEAKENGFREIIVKTGSIAPTRKKFMGRILAKGQTREHNGANIVTYKVFMTMRGKFALYIEDVGDTTSSTWWVYKTRNARPDEIYRFDVFETVDGVQSAVPQELYNAVLQAINTPDGIETLDI